MTREEALHDILSILTVCISMFGACLSYVYGHIILGFVFTLYSMVWVLTQCFWPKKKGGPDSEESGR